MIRIEAVKIGSDKGEENRDLGDQRFIVMRRRRGKEAMKNEKGKKGIGR